MIYADTLEEHRTRVHQVLSALRAAKLFCSPKKTKLAGSSCEFLGHVITRDGLLADPEKIGKIRNWTVPRTARQVRGFLGLVQYLKKFIMRLAEFTATLTPLTKKGMTDISGRWGEPEQAAFEGIKETMTSLPCLKPMDYAKGPDPIWLMTDASNVGIGAVLMQGPTWQMAHPLGYYSRQYIPAEKNYPTHEQEQLAIIAAVKHWRMDLQGVHFTVLTDHATLTSLPTQDTLSKRQARWMEAMADYDMEIVYVEGAKNTVADSLSRFSFPPDVASMRVAGVSQSMLSPSILQRVKDGYLMDAFCKQMLDNVSSMPGVELIEGVLYFENRMVIPADAPLREEILHNRR